MDLCDHSPSYIRAISPYRPGMPISALAREMELAEDELVKLASNENPLGASPRALAAMEKALADIARYPDGNGFDLKSVLARRFGVDSDRIVIGNGSNDLLDLAARAFLAPGTSAVYSKYAFAVYPLVTQATGARGIEARARGFGHDLEAMLDAVAEDTRIVFIANPNNPTGTLLSAKELECFLPRIPRDVMVLLDEAYTEYLPPAERYDSVAWLESFPNLVLTRTFSKAYGLAGLRVGFALAHPRVADLLNRVRQPFNANSLAMAAAAAALEDECFLDRCVGVNRAGMAQLTAGFARLGLEYIPSYANFVTVKVGDAAAVNGSLLKQGVIVRPVGNYGMPEYLRVSVGLEAENAKFLHALEKSLAAGGKFDSEGVRDAEV